MDNLKLVFSIIGIIIGLVFFFKPSILDWRFKEFLDDKKLMKQVHIHGKIFGIFLSFLGFIFFILLIVSDK